MTIRKNGKGVIRLGDTTSHGGEVISVAHKPKDMGKPIACVGDMVRCPKCKGTYPIAEGDPNYQIENVPVAFDGHKTACGAVLISSI